MFIKISILITNLFFMLQMNAMINKISAEIFYSMQKTKNYYFPIYVKESESKIVSLSPQQRYKHIESHGFVGCVASILYLKSKNETQHVLFSHYGAIATDEHIISLIEGIKKISSLNNNQQFKTATLITAPPGTFETYDNGYKQLSWEPLTLTGNSHNRESHYKKYKKYDNVYEIKINENQKLSYENGDFYMKFISMLEKIAKDNIDTQQFSTTCIPYGFFCFHSRGSFVKPACIEVEVEENKPLIFRSINDKYSSGPKIFE